MLELCHILATYVLSLFDRIAEAANTTASGILDCINSVMVSKGIPRWKENLIGFGADGAATNFGKHHGVFAQLSCDMPWLMGIHCVAHRLELACKDALKDSYFNEVCSSYTSYFNNNITI